MTQDRLLSIISGDDRSLTGRAARLGFCLLEPAYCAGIGLRNRMFDFGLRQSARLARPVISVGNLTTGGTGKTPLVIEIARRLTRQRIRVAVLLRGYKSQGNGSDEMKMLQAELGDVAVESGSSRVDAAARILQRHADLDVFILDDGFQHRQVRRDVDLVLIDATRPFGYGHILPRGLMREPLRNLKRADAVILTRTNCVESHRLASLVECVSQFGGGKTIQASFHWSGYLDRANRRHNPDHLAHERVLGVCGIGNPQAFASMLARHAEAYIVTFNDHHRYTSRDLNHVLAAARNARASAVVTTEKDWVKLHTMVGPEFDLPVYRPILHISFDDGADVMEKLLSSLTQKMTARDHWTDDAKSTAK